jgi:hypothetical protein
VCVACCFKSFGDSKYNTRSDLSLRYSFLTLRLRLLVTLSRFLSLYHKALDCGLAPYSLAQSLILDCSTGELVVLGGTVSRYLTVLPSGIIFQSSFRHSSIFWMKLTDFATCIGVHIAMVGTRWGVSLWPYCYGLSNEAMPPFTTTNKDQTNNKIAIIGLALRIGRLLVAKIDYPIVCLCSSIHT